MSETIEEIRARNLWRRLKTARAVEDAGVALFEKSMRETGIEGAPQRRNLAARSGAWRGMADAAVDLITREAAQ